VCAEGKTKKKPYFSKEKEKHSTKERKEIRVKKNFSI
jgi:hypothetical protein